jgi:hypothetical protein
MKAVSLRSFTAYWGALAVIAACGGSSDTQGGAGGFAAGPDATTGSSSGSSSGGSGSGNNYSSSGSSGGSGDDSSAGPSNGCPASCSADADCQNMCTTPAAMGSIWCCMAGTCAQAAGSCPTTGDAGDNG